MAHLEVQEKRGANWLWWIVALIIVALIIWWVLSRNTDNTTVSNGALAVPAAVPDSTYSTGMNSETITDLSMLTSASEAGDLAGRPVALTNVPVPSVVSDMGFWAGSGTAAGESVFVVRGNQNASYTAPDGAVDPGEHVTIYGVVREMPSNLTQQTTEWNLKSTDAETLAARPIYISADSVRIVH